MYRKDCDGIRPRNGREFVVGIIARISGCASQKELSLEDQVANGKVEAEYPCPGKKRFLEFTSIGKGESLDREELQEIRETLKRGELDLLVMEDLGRLLRGHGAVDFLGLAVDNGTRVIVPNDGIDTAEPCWEQLAINASSKHVGHNDHTSWRLKQKMMNRFVTRGGAIARPIAGYIVPEKTSPDQSLTYNDWQKDPAATSWIQKGAELLLSTLNASVVADWFNDNGVPDGPYTRKKGWTGARVLGFYKNSLLKGKPGRGYKRTVKHHQTGRRVSRRNPKGPAYFDVPHLAHLDAAQFDELNRALQAQNARHKRPLVKGRDSRTGIPKKRTRFPGQHARCHYCGRICFWGANGLSDNLMCSGARDWHCWNSVGFNGPLLVKRLISVICDELQALEGFHEQFAEMVLTAQDQTSDGLDVALADLQRQLGTLATEKANILGAVKQVGSYPTLQSEIEALESRELELKQTGDKLDRQGNARLRLPNSPVELNELFQKEIGRLAINSPEFGVLMRDFVPQISIYLVRRFDGGPLLPRAKVTLDLAANFPDVAMVPGLQQLLRRDVTLDLFELRQVDQIREPAWRLMGDGLTHAQIADRLPQRPTKTAVGRAIEMQRQLLSRGLESPYVVIQQPPDDYKKLRRHRNKRYRFEPLDGYTPPPL